MATQDPGLILAAGGGLHTLDTPDVAYARQIALAQARQNLQNSGAAQAQDLQIGGEKLQAAKYANQETAAQFASQQALMQEINNTVARRAAANSPQPGTPPGPPAPSAPFIRTADGMIVRDPALVGNNAPAGTPPRNGITPVPSPASLSPSIPPDPRSVFEESIDNLQGKVRPSDLLVYQGQNLAMKEKMATVAATMAKANKTAQELQDAHHASLGALMQTVKDDDYSQRSLLGALAFMHSYGFDKEAQQIGQAFQQNPDNIKGLVDPFISQRSPQGIEATAKETTAGPEAALKTAQVPGAEAESQRQQLITQSVKAALDNPQQGSDLIDQALPASLDTQANSSFKAAWQAAMQSGNVDGAAKIVGAAADHAAAISRATNPDILNAEVNKSVRVAQATAPIEIGKSIAIAKNLRQGDNPAVAGVAPASVGQVQNSAIKLDSDYIKAKATTDSMGQFLDLAEKGNKAAGSNLPLVGVETLNAINGIKRINTAEINQYEGAGSLLDQIQGKIGKLTVGKPITQDVLNDIRQLHQVLGNQSYQQYQDGLNSLNQRTGSNFKPTIAPPNISRGAKQNFKVGDTVMYNGQPHKVTGINGGKLVLDGSQ